MLAPGHWVRFRLVNGLIDSDPVTGNLDVGTTSLGDFEGDKIALDRAALEDLVVWVGDVVTYKNAVETCMRSLREVPERLTPAEVPR